MDLIHLLEIILKGECKKAKDISALLDITAVRPRSSSRDMRLFWSKKYKYIQACFRKDL